MSFGSWTEPFLLNRIIYENLDRLRYSRSNEYCFQFPWWLSGVRVGLLQSLLAVLVSSGVRAENYTCCRPLHIYTSTSAVDIHTNMCFLWLFFSMSFAILNVSFWLLHDLCCVLAHHKTHKKKAVSTISSPAVPSLMVSKVNNCPKIFINYALCNEQLSPLEFQSYCHQQYDHKNMNLNFCVSRNKIFISICVFKQWGLYKIWNYDFAKIKLSV